MGISFRTKHPVAKPSQSAIRDHYEQCGHCDITVDKFKILGSAREAVDLRILVLFISLHKLQSFSKYLKTKFSKAAVVVVSTCRVRYRIYFSVLTA